MASKGKIDEIVDVPAVKKQIDYLNTSLNELIKLMGKLSTSSADVSSNLKFAKSTTDVNKSLKELAEVQAKATTASKSYSDVTAKLAQETARLNSLNNGGAKAELELLTIKQKRIAREKELLQQAKDAINSNNKQKQSIEEQIAAAKRQVNSIRAIEEETKKLQQIKKDIILVEGKQSKQVAEINAMIDKNTKILRQNGDEASKQRMNIGNYKSAFDGIGEKIKAAFSVAGILAAGAAVAGFFKSSFAASEQQEKANRRLLNSLNQNKQAYEELTKQANKLQSQTGIADDAIMQIQQLGASAGLTTEQIKRITAASVELSAKKNIDLQSAYDLLAKSMVGVGKGLKSLGPDFANLTAEQLKNGAAIDVILQKYSGFAAASASETEKLAANWDEFNESAGATLGSIVNPALKETNEILNTINNKQGFWQKFATLVGFAAGPGVGVGVSTAFDAKNIIGSQSANPAASKAIEESQKKTFEAQQRIKKAYAAIDAMNEADNEATVKQIKAQISEQQKLTDRITELTNAMVELKLSQQPIPNSMIHELISSQTALENVKKEVEGIAAGMIAIQAKGYQSDKAGNLIPIAPTNPQSGTGLLQPRAIDWNAANDKGTSPDFLQTDAGQAAIDGAQITADATFAIVSDQMNAEYDLKLSMLNKEMEAELKHKNLTEAQKDKIREKYAKKEAKLKEEQFKKEKAANIIQAIINTALAVTKALPNAIQASLAAAAGAAQIAVIAAQPIPKYFKGRDGGPAEFAIVGEQGREAILHDGKMMLTPDMPTMTFLPAGASVIPNKDLMSMSESLTMGRIPQYDGGLNTKELERKISDLYGGFEMLAKVVKSKKEFHAIFDRNGIETFVKNGASQTEYVNNNIRF